MIYNNKKLKKLKQHYMIFQGIEPTKTETRLLENNNKDYASR